jgi:hypothetical protein
MIENTRDISVWLPWYAISAMQFARRYIEPKQDQETYNTIYNIYYLFFKQLDEYIKRNGKVTLMTTSDEWRAKFMW